MQFTNKKYGRVLLFSTLILFLAAALHAFEPVNNEKNEKKSRRAPALSARADNALSSQFVEKHPELEPEIERVKVIQGEIEQIKTLYQEESNPEEKEQLKQQLRFIVEERFDLLANIRMVWYQDAENKLEKSQKHFEERLENKEEEIEKTVEKMLAEKKLPRAGLLRKKRKSNKK